MKVIKGTDLFSVPSLLWNGAVDACLGHQEASPGSDILSNLICPLGSHPRRCNFLETVSIFTQFSLLMGRPK